MRRLCAISAIFILCSGIFIGGCSRKPQKNDDDNPIAKVDPNIQVDPDPNAKGKGKGGDKKTDPATNKAIDADTQEKYDTALADALAALAERKWEDALDAFEAANSFQSNDFVKGEITKLRERIGQEGLAKNTVKNIEIVLNDGDADEAARLANEALKDFGDGEDADQLIQLRIQADAVRNAQKKENNDVRFARLKKEGDLAVQEKNLRAAALAYEQAVEAMPDADLQKTAEGIRAQLDDYDALRKKGAELRRDPAQLEDALATFKAAANAWDTLQIRADIDDCQLALAKRREAVAVVDFEQRNDVGAPGVGAAIADDLLPRLKPKFDLVERGALRQVIGELNVQKGFLDDPKQQQQIGKVVKARYLVVGSIQRLVGVTIRARLVDVQTGLIVQSAKVVGADLEEAINQVPDLAKQLLMTDEAKMAFEQEVRQKVARPVEKAPDNAPIRPAPLPAAADAPPPPPPIVNPAPPMFVDQKPNVFKNFAPPPATFVAPPADPFQGPQRNRLLFASVEMGDYLFRVGRYREALRQYDFALMLAPEDFEIQVRVERTRPFVPLTPFFAPKPRLAVMPFMTVGNPFVVPPSLGYWTPSNLSPYFAYRFDVVDSSEIYWYMGRMGLTMNDLLVDPNARRWLGRAVGVRFFLFGNHLQTTSFDVNTYLIDAESGYLQGTARINVQDTHELKLRLPELAELTMMTPAEQAAYLAAAQQKRYFGLVHAGRAHLAERRFRDAQRDFEAALQIYPNDVQVRVLLEQARGQAIFVDFQIGRQTQWQKEQAFQAAQRQRQWEMAQAAEAARRRAIAEAAARDDAQRQAHVGFRVVAQNSLIARAEVALQTKNFGLSLSFFRGAENLTPVQVVGAPPPVPPVINYQSFGQARIEAERGEQARLAQIALAREQTLRVERDKQLAAAQKQIVAERAAAQAKLDAERKAQADHDLVAFNAAIKQGQGYLTQKKYEAALAAFQGAQRVAHTQKQNEQVNNYVDIIVQAQAEASATTKEQKSAVEQKLALERERRKAADSLARQNEEKYQLALTAARTALAARNYDTAEAKFHEAEQVFKTDAALNGLREVANGRKALLADSQKEELAKKKSERVTQFLLAGKASFESKKYAEAVTAYREAKKLAPDNLAASAGLTQAEQANARVSAEATRKAEQASRVANFQRLLKNGQANLATKQYEAAVASLGEAVKLNPTDAIAVAALKQAEKGRDASNTDAKTKAAAKERTDKYQKFLSEGRVALDSKRFPEAIKAFGEAQKLLPGDKTSKEYLSDAQAAQKAEANRVALVAKQRADDLKRSADLQAALQQGRTALALKNFSVAAKALAAAQKLGPDNAEVKTALRELDQAQKQAAGQAAAEKARLTQFETYLSTGKTALAGQKYAEAIKALSSASTLFPDNKEAQDLFRLAQSQQRQAEAALAKANLQNLITTGLAALKAKNYDAAEKALRSASLVEPTNPSIVQGLKEVDAGRKVQGDTKQRLANFNLAMSQGLKSFQTKDYKTAIASAQAALQLIPDDADASKLLQQAKLAQGQSDKANAAFDTAMDTGRKALNGKFYDAAIKAFNDALKLNPNDAMALQLRTQAQQALADAQRTFNYQKAMTAGQSALKGKKYQEAVLSFQAALKVVPNDPAATQQLTQAQQLLRDSMKVKMPVDPPKVADFDGAMQRGAAAESQLNYKEALNAYFEALKFRPKDKQADAKFQLAKDIVEGEQALAKMAWVEAVREFESALRRDPKNQYVLKQLQKAKNKGK